MLAVANVKPASFVIEFGNVKLAICICMVLLHIIMLAMLMSILGATYIKNMLIINKKLQHLGIGGNQFGDDGVRCVAEGLHHNDVLTELRLHDCKITVKGMIKDLYL